MDPRATPDVTVVVPTKDGWPLVARTVDSALAQRGVDVEVIVVDDGSTDGSGDLLRGRGVEVVRHDLPRGPSKARNAGLAVASGTWTAFLDHDDLWSPDKLRAQLDAASAAGAAFAFTAALTVDEELRPIRWDPAPTADPLLPDLLRHDSIPGGCSNVVARTDLLRELGGFDEQLFYLADWELWIRLAAAGRGAPVAETHVAYLEHAGGMHVHSAGRGLGDLERMRAKHRALWEPLGVDMGAGAWFPLWFAAHVLQGGNRLRAVALYLGIARRHRSPGALLRAAAAPFTERFARRDVAGSHELPVELPGWLDAYRAQPQA